MWPIYVFMMAIFIVESAFYTVGVLASEEPRGGSFWGTFLIPAYLFPRMLSGLVIEKVTNRYGEKKTAFISGLIGGIVLFLASFANNAEVLVGAVFVAGVALSGALPAVMAAVANYVTRLKSFGGDMIGLKNSAMSFSYIIDPIVAGWIGLYVGNIRAIGIIGLRLSGDQYAQHHDSSTQAAHATACA